jgi:hypothetical protein
MAPSGTLSLRATQHSRDLRRCADGIGQHRLIAGDFLEHGKLSINGARLVMQQEATGALVRAWCAGDDYHRRTLRIGPRDRTDDIESPGPAP